MAIERVIHEKFSMEGLQCRRGLWGITETRVILFPRYRGISLSREREILVIEPSPPGEFYDKFILQQIFQYLKKIKYETLYPKYIYLFAYLFKIVLLYSICVGPSAK